MHERAVQYFRRALRLNPAYLSAWTLMGHEYVELKNPPAAIGVCAASAAAPPACLPAPPACTLVCSGAAKRFSTLLRCCCCVPSGCRCIATPLTCNALHCCCCPDDPRPSMDP